MISATDLLNKISLILKAFRIHKGLFRICIVILVTSFAILAVCNFGQISKSWARLQDVQYYGLTLDGRTSNVSPSLSV